MRSDSLLVETIDGWKLTVFRKRIHSNSLPVLLWHGLSTCSEIFLSHQESVGLAEFLAKKGFDVFLGNSRGNKYTSRESGRNWEFCLDEGVIDVQAVIDKVLQVTGKKSLVYIGFSQGSAIGLAALSFYHELNHKISHFIGLAPAMKPKSWNENITGFVSWIEAHRLGLVFGKGSFLPVGALVSENFPAVITRSIIKTFITTVLGWKLENYGPMSRQLVLYRNIFGTTSTKTFIHWFQILSAGKFQLYDGRHYNTFSPTNPKPSTPPLQFPTNHITTRISLFCGQDDNLSDVEYLKSKLPEANVVVVEGYEHLDVIWAQDAPAKWDSILKEIGDPFKPSGYGTFVRDVIALDEIDVPAACL